MKDLYLVGAGGCGREVLQMVIDWQKQYGPKWNIKGFLDDTEDPLKGKACDYGVVGTIRDYRPKSNDRLLMCIASPQTKRRLVSKLKERGAVFDSFISPNVYMGRHNQIGEGVIIYGGFVMSVNITIGNFVTLIGCGTVFGHDVSVGDYCTISGNCSLTGYAKVGQGVFLGDSVRVAPHVEVGDNATAHIGSVIVRNVMPGSTVFGNPAREIK